MIHNPAIDCGLDPADGLIVAYLPPMTDVMDEYDTSHGTLYVVDGTAIDLLPTGRWWKVREARAEAFKNTGDGIRLCEPLYQGSVADFTTDRYEAVRELPAWGDDYKLHMRAYSHGPWICIEKQQLDEVYNKENDGGEQGEQLEARKVRGDEDGVLPEGAGDGLGES